MIISFDYDLGVHISIPRKKIHLTKALESIKMSAILDLKRKKEKGTVGEAERGLKSRSVICDSMLYHPFLQFHKKLKYF